MKTSNKTNRRFLGITIILMVLSLVCGNLAAQKSFNEFTFASLNYNYFQNSKNEILHAISKSNTKYNQKSEESIQDWMVNPADWKTESHTESGKEVKSDENEMILEDWMLNPADWTTNDSDVLTEEVNFEEQEMILEDWMMKTNWEDHSLIEEELQVEDWMTNPENW